MKTKGFFAAILISSFISLSVQAAENFQLALDIGAFTSTPRISGAGHIGLSLEAWDKDEITIGFITTELNGLTRPNSKLDWLISGGAVVRIFDPMYFGGRIGSLLNYTDSRAAFGAICIRIKDPFGQELLSWMSLPYAEVDLGIAGAGDRYSTLRFGLSFF